MPKRIRGIGVELGNYNFLNELRKTTKGEVSFNNIISYLKDIYYKYQELLKKVSK